MAISLQSAAPRAINIARLDIATYEQVEADTSLTQEAGAVVAVTAVVGSLGFLFRGQLWGFIASILIMLIGWGVWAWISAFIAERVFNIQTTNVGEMLRTTGYAYAPMLLGIVPYLGLLGMIWALVAVVVGMRQAAEMTTIQAIITALIGFLPAMIAMGIISAILT